MTHHGKMIEALAIRFENYRLGKYGFTSGEAAAAVLELVGPRKLEWAKEANSPYHKSGRYTVYQVGSVLGAPTNWLVDFGNSTRRWEPTLESAQAAAQAHADAVHWANTKMEKQL